MCKNIDVIKSLIIKPLPDYSAILLNNKRLNSVSKQWSDKQSARRPSNFKY